MWTRMVLVAMVASACGDVRSTADRGPDASASVLLGPGSATHPAVSPDGMHVAFLSNAPGVPVDRLINFEIFVATIDGDAPRRLTENDAFDSEIAWAPDGDRIAFKSHRDGNDEIYVMRADGSDQRNLTHDPGSDFHPDWSPDGSLILFASDRDGPADLYLMRPDGGDVQRLTADSSSNVSPAWSPDARRIAFVSNRAGTDDIYIMDRDGGGVRRRASSPDSDWSPRWSPDGTTLLYISGNFAEDRWNLLAVDADGETSPRVVVEGVDSGNPSWHPSGERIYFGRYIDGESRLFSSRPDGTDIRPLAQD